MSLSDEQLILPIPDKPQQPKGFVVPGWVLGGLSTVAAGACTAFATWLGSQSAAIAAHANQIAVLQAKQELNTRESDRIESQFTQHLQRIENKLDRVIEKQQGK